MLYYFRLSGEECTNYFVFQVSSPTIIVERAGSYAWTHRSWRIREEFARTVISAISLFASTERPLQRASLPPVCSLTFPNWFLVVLSLNVTDKLTFINFFI